VQLANEPVKVRADGSFTVRMSMPDRRQVIPIVAASSDGVDGFPPPNRLQLTVMTPTATTNVNTLNLCGMNSPPWAQCRSRRC
jgi:hypothetical protein